MFSIIFNHIIDILIAVGAALGFWGIGRCARRLMLRSIGESALTAIFDYGIGAWITWTAFFFLGLLGGYHPWVARLVLSICALAGLWQLWQMRASLPSSLGDWRLRGDFYQLALVAICAIIILLAICGALTPPAAQDALVHHLAMPKTLIKIGRLVEFPYNYFSYFPAGMEMLFLYGLLLRGAAVATLLHFNFGIATFAAILAGGQALGFSRRARLIAATAFLSVPTIWMEMTWAYIDLSLTFFVTLAVLALLCYRSERRNDWIWLVGFALGCTLSLKYTALFVVMIIPLLLLFIMREHKQTTIADMARVIFLPMVIALAVCSPWYARNLINTGNPLFPFFLNLIPSHNPGWDIERAKLVLMGMNRYGGDNKSLLGYLLMPFKLSFLARYDSIQFYQGIIGQFYLFSLPLFLLIRRARAEARYLLGFSLAFYLFWIVSSQQIRYLLPVLPALALAIASAEDQIASINLNGGWIKWLHRGLLALAMLIFLINTATIIKYFFQFNYPQVLIGKLSQAQYLTDKFDYYPAYEFINAYTPRDSKIFLIDTSNQSYYLDRDYFSDSVFEDYTISHIVAAARVPDDIKAQLRARGMTHLLYRVKILFGSKTGPFTYEQNDLFIQFLRQDCQVMYLDQDLALFAINP